MSGNLDAPEGGLDAVMQAISCEVSKSTVMYVCLLEGILVGMI